MLGAVRPRVNRYLSSRVTRCIYYREGNRSVSINPSFVLYLNAHRPANYVVYISRATAAARGNTAKSKTRAKAARPFLFALRTNYNPARNPARTENEIAYARVCVPSEMMRSRVIIAVSRWCALTSGGDLIFYGNQIPTAINDRLGIANNNYPRIERFNGIILVVVKVITEYISCCLFYVNMWIQTNIFIYKK